jgi:D-3-phosphoglycerate dehydrogenase
MKQSMLVVIADNMEESVVKAISELGEVRNKPEDVKAAIAEADALIVRSATKVTKELIADSKLKLVIRAGVGTDNIDKEACKEKGIKVRNTPGASSNAVAELVLGLAICGLRNVQRAHHQMKNEKWEKKKLTGNEISGKTLGVIGYGRIGGLLGKKANSLGMEVVASDPHPREDGIAKFMSNEDVFSKADVITLHVPALPGTINLINKGNISKMKDGAFIINTSRGEIIDEDALYDACKEGKLKGAALDVYRQEPYKGKLLELENVYFTPHLGAATKEAQVRIGEEVIATLKEEL